MELPFLNWLYTAVAWVITHIHAGYSTFIPASSGLNWALTIITLTVLMRLLIFPLFMKQMRSSRKMQELAPKVQDLRKKYKNDKQRMNQEVMRLYQEAGANPLGGCLPIVAQFPIFISMFTVLRAIAEDRAVFGMTKELVESAREAHVFGAPLPATFFTSAADIEKFGADSLRFGLAYLTTETQDVRMPVQFECPHCATLIDQTKKNRQLPRVECKKCGKPFSTQWAETPEDQALPRGAVVSERFELGRNFCNKLWNAARFTMLNLEGYTPGVVSPDELELEDRWILSRLYTVTQEVTRCYESYGYADAARATYDFAWDEFCSFYVEILKERFQKAVSRLVAQRVITYVLDSLLRLLHPIIPFITEEIWQTLGKIAPERGLSEIYQAPESIMESTWPQIESTWEDQAIERQFAVFQETLGTLREIRSRQNIVPKDTIEFVIRCDDATAQLLETMSPYFLSMANAKSRGLGQDVEVPETNATITVGAMEVYVDLKDFIDVGAEIERNEKHLAKLLQLVTSKENKLNNDSFVSRAPADIVQRERESLEQARQELERTQAALTRLRESATN